MVGVVILAVVGYAGYEAVRPLTPGEVAARFIAAPGVAEAKALAAPPLHPALDALYAAAGPGREGDEARVTREEPAPPGVGGHYAWVRETGFDPDTGRSVTTEGRLHLTRSDGWKVADFAVLSYDGQSFDPPVSLAREYRTLFPAAGPSPPPAGRESTKSAARVGAFGLLAAVKSGAAKGIGVAALAAAAAAWAWLKRTRRPNPGGGG